MRALLIMALSLVCISRAEAHAFLDHAEPKVGSTVRAPTQVKIWMTMHLEKTYSTLQVFDARGEEVDSKDVQVSEDLMSVSVPRLAPGTYMVQWKALAVCTHKTAGKFTFTVE